MSGHTPGPWVFDGNCGGYIADATEAKIARAYSHDDAFLIAAAPRSVGSWLRGRYVPLHGVFLCKRTRARRRSQPHQQCAACSPRCSLQSSRPRLPLQGESMTDPITAGEVISFFLGMAFMALMMWRPR